MIIALRSIASGLTITVRDQQGARQRPKLPAQEALDYNVWRCQLNHWSRVPAWGTSTDHLRKKSGCAQLAPLVPLWSRPDSSNWTNIILYEPGHPVIIPGAPG